MRTLNAKLSHTTLSLFLSEGEEGLSPRREFAPLFGVERTQNSAAACRAKSYSIGWKRQRLLGSIFLDSARKAELKFWPVFVGVCYKPRGSRGIICQHS